MTREGTLRRLGSRSQGLQLPLTPRRFFLSVLLALAAILPTSLAFFGPSAFASNVNFIGKWTPNTGYSWTVKTENLKTGACTATTALAKSGYRLLGCHVTGRKYVFTITLGSSYKSRNTGTITGNTLKGTFSDTNGTVEHYTARRKAI